MTYETSCGAVVFTRRGGEILYVIIRSIEGYYGFPKGHMEGDETPEQTALREIREEVGLTPRLIDGFRTEEEHRLPKKPNVMKRVIYFVAEYEDQPIVPQKEELLSAQLLPYDQARALFQFENTKEILDQAKAFIETL